MEKYNYKEVMKNDVLEAIKEYMEYGGVSVEDLDIDALSDYLWANDSVTGNGSGSYTMDSALSQEYVLDNDDLQIEVIKEFGLDSEDIADNLHNWEYWDVSIRCYLLDVVLQDVLEELQEDIIVYAYETIMSNLQYDNLDSEKNIKIIKDLFKQ